MNLRGGQPTQKVELKGTAERVSAGKLDMDI
jgi:hypothetical protein